MIRSFVRSLTHPDTFPLIYNKSCRGRLIVTMYLAEAARQPIQLHRIVDRFVGSLGKIDGHDQSAPTAFVSFASDESGKITFRVEEGLSHA